MRLVSVLSFRVQRTSLVGSARTLEVVERQSSLERSHLNDTEECKTMCHREVKSQSTRSPSLEGRKVQAVYDR